MILHRSSTWWIKIFLYLLQIYFCNFLVIWKALQRTRVDAEKFRLTIAHGLLDGYQIAISCRRSRLLANPPERIVMGEHYTAINLNLLPNGKPSRRDCTVCSDRRKRRHQTYYVCQTCNVALCPYPCHERYHTLLSYKVNCTAQLHQE